MIAKGSFLEVHNPRHLRASTHPPSSKIGTRMANVELEKGQILGPVLDSEQSHMFATVLIQHPVTCVPAWVNIWARENNQKVPKGIYFCMLLSVSKGQKKQKTIKNRQKAQQQKESGVAFPIDLDSEEDEFEVVPEEERFELNDEMISEEKETLGMSGKDDPLFCHFD